jgi:hypothetical protein
LMKSTDSHAGFSPTLHIIFLHDWQSIKMSWAKHESD